MEQIIHAYRCIAFLFSLGCGVWVFFTMDSDSLLGFMLRVVASLFVAAVVAALTGAGKLAEGDG